MRRIYFYTNFATLWHKCVRESCSLYIIFVGFELHTQVGTKSVDASLASNRSRSLRPCRFAASHQTERILGIMITGKADLHPITQRACEGVRALATVPYGVKLNALLHHHGKKGLAFSGHVAQARKGRAMVGVESSCIDLDATLAYRGILSA